jgi:hypothetical protein
LAVGDWGRRGEHNQREVAGAMARVAADSGAAFTVSTGDNFYDHGVDSAGDTLWQLSFERVYDHPPLQHPWLAVLGNHDWHGNWRAQIRYTERSGRWRMPGLWHTVQRQTVDSTGVRLVFLETNVIANPDVRRRAAEALGHDPVERQLAWLDSLLSASEERWTVAVGHHPIYASGHHGGSVPVRRRLEPILHRHGVQLWLSGHEHDLQHQDPGTGTQYFVSGAGSKVRQSGADARTRLALGRTPGFLLVTVYADSLRVDVFDSRPVRLYHATLGPGGDVIGGGERTVRPGRWFPPW